MSLTSFPERLSHALATPGQGVIGLVDELLSLSLKHDLQLAWHEGLCQVDFLDANRLVRIELPLPQSVFRAVLTRVAVFCNEQELDSVTPYGVTPYGGQGVVASDVEKVVRVTFVNTPDQQSLELTSASLGTKRPVMGSSLSALIEESGTRR